VEYPATLTPDDNGTWFVTFPDIAGVTFGDTVEDALRHASDALATMLEAYIKDRRPIPPPSARRTKYRVRVPALLEAKIRLYTAMREADVGKAELGRRLAWHPPQVDRLLAMTHGSRLDQLECAFQALGKRLVVSVEDEAAPRSRRRAIDFSDIPELSPEQLQAMRRDRAAHRHIGRPAEARRPRRIRVPK
jgi:antitoxin HicB